MSRELYLLILRQHQGLLEVPTNLHEHILSGGICLTTFARASGASPKTDAVEALAHVDNYALHFAVLFVLEGLADGGEHDVQPDGVDVNGLLVAVLEGPFAAVFVLGVFPFGTDAGFEEVVVGLLGKLRGWRDVVLRGISLCGLY
jgi:hypothetical protein